MKEIIFSVVTLWMVILHACLGYEQVQAHKNEGIPTFVILCSSYFNLSTLLCGLHLLLLYLSLKVFFGHPLPWFFVVFAFVAFIWAIGMLYIQSVVISDMITKHREDRLK